MRILLMGLVILLLVLSCGLAVRYNQNANYAREELNSERYRRMIIEEGLQNANAKINTLNLELKSSQSKIESTEIVLEKTKAISRDLKNRLDKASRIQASLDKRIKDLQQLTSPL